MGPGSWRERNLGSPLGDSWRGMEGQGEQNQGPSHTLPRATVRPHSPATSHLLFLWAGKVTGATPATSGAALGAAGPESTGQPERQPDAPAQGLESRVQAWVGQALLRFCRRSGPAFGSAPGPGVTGVPGRPAVCRTSGPSSSSYAPVSWFEFSLFIQTPVLQD